jgi:hypothetical protein
MMKRTIATSIFALALVACNPYVWASPPNGVPPKDAQEAFSKADVVFLGRVEKVLKDTYGYDSTAQVQVQTVWKGNALLSSFILVDGGGGPTYPSRIFKLGETYLFYLPVVEKGKLLRADSFLNRVLPKNEASGDLAYLSKAQKL